MCGCEYEESDTIHRQILVSISQVLESCYKRLECVRERMRDTETHRVKE